MQQFADVLPDILEALTRRRQKESKRQRGQVAAAAAEPTVHALHDSGAPILEVLLCDADVLDNAHVLDCLRNALCPFCTAFVDYEDLIFHYDEIHGTTYGTHLFCGNHVLGSHLAPIFDGLASFEHSVAQLRMQVETLLQNAAIGATKGMDNENDLNPAPHVAEPAASHVEGSTQLAPQLMESVNSTVATAGVAGVDRHLASRMEALTVNETDAASSAPLGDDTEASLEITFGDPTEEELVVDDDNEHIEITFGDPIDD